MANAVSTVSRLQPGQRCALLFRVLPCKRFHGRERSVESKRREYQSEACKQRLSARGPPCGHGGLRERGEAFRQGVREWLPLATVLPGVRLCGTARLSAR